MSVENRIHENAARNRELLGILAETDHAPPALQQQDKYVSDLENDARQLDATIKRLEASRQKELKDHEKYRDSTMKRFAYKVARKTEKFEAKASKEEQEYFQALQEEHSAKEARKWTQSNLDDAKRAQSQLRQVMARHKQAQKDLDALYDSIFAGPTPSFPEEDEKEQASERALYNYHDVRMKSEAETQVKHIFDQAIRQIKEAMVQMENALHYSRRDMFGGGTITDMMERNALSRAQTATMEVQMLIQQAKRISPFVQNIPRPNIAQGDIMMDVFFDNIFTDMAFHDKIKQSQAEVQQCANAILGEARNTEQRLNELNSKLSAEQRTLEDSRVALQRAREQVFEKTVGAGHG